MDYHNTDVTKNVGSVMKCLKPSAVCKELYLSLIVPSANSVSPLNIAIANRLIHAIHKNCIVYLFL